MKEIQASPKLSSILKQNPISYRNYANSITWIEHTQPLLFRQSTLRQATLNTIHYIFWDPSPEMVDGRAINIEIATRTSRNKLILEPKVVLSNLTDSRLRKIIISIVISIISRLQIRHLHPRQGTQPQIWLACNQD